MLTQDIRERAGQIAAGTLAPVQSLDRLDDQGCVFVLRFILIAFRGRRPQDRFWGLLKQFLVDARIVGDARDLVAKDLLLQASGMQPPQAKALLDFLSQAYSQNSERLFWSTLGDAIQIYGILPVA